MQSKTLKTNCSFCGKEIECPENMIKAEYHACFECFQDKEEELSNLEKGKLHVDMPADKLVPEVLTNSLVNEAFPEIWNERKQKLKEMSKKELAEEMFGAGAFIAINNILAMIKKEEERENKNTKE